MNPMVDGWRGDDRFHNSAFHEPNLAYVYEQEATRHNDLKWWSSHYDDYDEYLQAGSAGEAARRHGMELLGLFNKLSEHPASFACFEDPLRTLSHSAILLHEPVSFLHLECVSIGSLTHPVSEAGLLIPFLYWSGLSSERS